MLARVSGATLLRPAATVWPGDAKRHCTHVRVNRLLAIPSGKEVWLETSSEEVVGTAVERGVTTYVLSPQNDLDPVSCRQLGASRVLCREQQVIHDDKGKLVGQVVCVDSPEDLRAAEDLVAGQSCAGQAIVLEAEDWKVIPAENLVALIQAAGSSASLFATVNSAAAARLMLGALEVGPKGVILRTDEEQEVLELMSFLSQIHDQQTRSLPLVAAEVVGITPLGIGDRVCVDLAARMAPGEGLLVGSFSRGLFLVHSECEESRYISSRPFRVNAGPVHAYVLGPGDRTSYLSELKSGDEVVVVDAQGRFRNEIVGRVKVEKRPLVRVECRIGEDVVSLMLQNAETVKLVSPSTSQAGSHGGWSALPVTSLSVGQFVLVHQQEGARHTGWKIDEYILEV